MSSQQFDARAACVWRVEGHDGAVQRILVIVPTMELDPSVTR
jgi:hypothetical protein